MAPRAAAAALTASIIATSTFLPLSASSDFGHLVDEIGTTMLARFPEQATDLGLSAALGLDDDRLDDLSREYRLETAALAEEALEQLAGVDAEALTSDERMTHAVATWYLDDIAIMSGYLDHDYAVNYITGAHADFPEFMADVHPVDDIADAEAYVERLRASAVQMRQVADHIVRAQERGILPTERGIGIAAWQISHQDTAAAAHPLVIDLRQRLLSLDLPEAEGQRLVDEAAAAVEDRMLPAYRDLLAVVRTVTTRPDSRPGVLHHPDGADYYAAALRHHTTTSLTPQEVHDIGLREVERVRGELTTALSEVGYDVGALGFTSAVLAASARSPSVPLDSDDDRDALLAATEDFIAEAERAFGGVFTTLPASPIEVQRPRPGREGTAGAYYRPPPAAGERPGIYYLSLGGRSFGTSTYATTNYHEAVPGHHFQLALQRESTDLPLIQRAAGFTGYAEGWALYAERLAHEAGLYAEDPLGNIGRLRMELLRAARAVVDTGIHALDWSRDESIEYLMTLGFPNGWAAAEVDRYIVWPGQAPAYIIGMLEILRLRDEAEAALEDDFDLAAFHDAILRHGSVPLELLDQVVAAHIAAAS